MAIKSNVGIGVTDIGTTDTTLYEPADPIDRVAFTACSLYNDSGASRTVSIYESPNLTSASGELIATYILADDASEDVIEIIGQGYAQGENLIIKADATGCTFRATITEYTGGS